MSAPRKMPLATGGPKKLPDKDPERTVTFSSPGRSVAGGTAIEERALPPVTTTQKPRGVFAAIGTSIAPGIHEGPVTSTDSTDPDAINCQAVGDVTGPSWIPGAMDVPIAAN